MMEQIGDLMIFAMNPDDKRHMSAFRDLLAQQVHHHNECGRGIFEGSWSEADIARSEANFYEGVREGSHHVFLYRENENSDICGMCAYRVFDQWIDGVKVAFVDELVIDENKRGHGLGRKFLLEMEEKMSSEGFDGLQLSCYLANEGAVEFYKAVSFVPVGIEFEKKFDKV